jgi:hypothetical protein
VWRIFSPTSPILIRNQGLWIRPQKSYWHEPPRARLGVSSVPGIGTIHGF